MNNSKINQHHNVIGKTDKGVSTHHSLNNLYKHKAFVSQIEPNM